MKGRLIVIDGIDGSGKATQTKLLAARLKKEKFRVKTIDFPRYQDNFFGKLIGECLTGAYGDFVGMNAHIASTLYAADRFESSKDIRKWIDAGYIVITDRYVSSNQIHQGGKIADLEERREFLKWLDVMEYKVYGIPKPDLVVYLDVPHEVSVTWLKNKVAQDKKKYLKGRKDTVEESIKYLRESRESALYLANQNKNWTRIECCQGMVCMPPEPVHEEVFKRVSKLVKKHANNKNKKA